MEAMTQSALILTASLALTWSAPGREGGFPGPVCADTVRPVHPQETPASVGDTLAHPIMLACGERLDPVGYVLGAARGLGLSAEQTAALGELDRVVRERNLPLAARWRSERDQEARASLRDSYRAAVEGVEEVLTEAQWRAALQPAFARDAEGEPQRGTVRCFFRSHLVVVR